MTNRRTASWVIVHRETDQAVLEIYNARLLPYLNTQQYKAVPILDYLYGLNG